MISNTKDSPVGFKEIIWMGYRVTY